MNLPHGNSFNEIFHTDDRETLELEIMKHGNLNNILRPSDDQCLNTLFHQAVEHGAFRCLKFLLYRSTGTLNLDLPNIYGKTPLHLAVEKITQRYNIANLNCLKILLHKGAYCNARDNDGNTPLHALAKYMGACNGKTSEGAETCLRLLLESESLNTGIQNRNKLTASQLEMQCTKINVENESNFVKKLSTYNSNLSWTSYETIMDCVTNFDANIYENNQKIHEIINRLESGANIYNRHIGNETMLFRIVAYCDLDLIDAILRRGCDPWCKNVGDGKLPLHAAMTRCDPTIVALVLHFMKIGANHMKVDLSTMSFSLLQSYLCNCNINDVDQIQCLTRLVNGNTIVDFDQKMEQDQVVRHIFLNSSEPKLSLNALSLAKWTKNQQAVEFLTTHCLIEFDKSQQTGMNFFNKYASSVEFYTYIYQMCCLFHSHTSLLCTDIYYGKSDQEQNTFVTLFIYF